MKTKRSMKIVSILFALILTMILPTIAMAADDTTDTTAIVGFKPGALIWGDLGNNNMDQMDLSFGINYRPTGAVQYNTVNNPHSLPVEDAREITDGWHVTVSMTEFSAPSLTNFAGVITLSDGVSDHAQVNALTPVVITSLGGEANVITAAVAADRGMFITLWDNAEDITLDLSKDEALKVRVTAPEYYTATLTWLLSAGPL